jgi:CRP-like cAMP-binding protein
MADKNDKNDKEYYSETIKSLVPINELSPQLQNEVINIGNILKFKKKEFVFKQGDRDRYAFYLLEGEVDLLSNNTVQSTLQSNSDSARYAMARLQPRQFSAKASTPITILQIDRAALDRLMVAEQQQSTQQVSGSTDMEVSELTQEDTGDWMTKMLQSELFCRLPTANIHQLFALLEPVEYEPGASVITQGDTGEHYYIIQEGKCEVTRIPSPGAKPVKLAELRSGDSFGEEALLTNAKRNASITMKTNGILMQLTKENFINLIKKPTLDEVTFSEGKKLVSEGAIWLDVRFQNEYEESNIEDSINVPLNMLRMQTEKLEQDKKYVIYCDTGGRSSAAAFLLTDRGFNVCFLKDGLTSVPHSELESKTPEKPIPATDTSVAKEKTDQKQQEPEDPELDREVRASVIEVDLERTNLDLKEAMERSAAEDKSKSKEVKEAQKRLLAEKKKLEAEKQAIEKEAKKVREQEAAKIRKMKVEAEKRLTAEKKKLEEIYSRNTKEMEKIQRLKEQAEEQLKREREKIEKEASEAREKHKEADKLKEQLEASRKALEQEAQKKRSEQDAMEQKIQAKAKANLEAERRKLAEEISRTNEELEKAKKAQLMAEATRKAAKDEAQQIIEEYKKQFEREQASEQQRLIEERKKLEEESRKIQETLKEIQKTRHDAEVAKTAAIQEAQNLRDRQRNEAAVQDVTIKKQVEAEIKAAEAKLEQAEKNLENVQQAEESMSAAKVVNEEELQRQKEEEERIQKEIQADLAEFKDDYEEQEKSRTHVVVQTDHVKRIKERASAAKHDAEKATDDLFADIAAQLGQED